MAFGMELDDVDKIGVDFTLALSGAAADRLSVASEAVEGLESLKVNIP